MSIFKFLNLLGSLGLFLYGMKVMSDALMDLAGDRMRKVMTRLTSNRFKGVLTGIFITGMIHSSSATTLMVVSFVNAQLLSLNGAISVIMGANIGTTFNAWLISVLGFKVKMSAIALPLIIVGFFFYLKKDRNLNNLGNFIIGFALLFIGLEFMKDSISGLENSTALFEFFQRNSERGMAGILLFVGIGTLLTLVLQSSSATMAITIVAASQGVMTFEAAAAIVLGENIGTTVTANLAALISGTDARRAALAHFLFNAIGVLWILILFKPFLGMVNRLSTALLGAVPMVNAADIPLGISVFHSTFNIINTAVLLIFLTSIAKVVVRLIPEKIEPEPVFSTPKYLNKEALKYPETSINALLQETRRLYRETIVEAVAHGIGVHRTDIKSDKPIEEIVKAKELPGIKYDDFIKTRIWPIHSEVLRFASDIQEKFQLTSEDNETVTQLKKINRYAQDILVNIHTLTSEIERHANDSNITLNEKYLSLQCAGIELIRTFLDANEDMSPQENIATLDELKKLAKENDVELLQDIDRLIREKKITSEQGVSLMTSSAAVLQIFKLLIKAAIYFVSTSSYDIQLEEVWDRR
ncbi:MAG: Na/Pi cotransporter family protein [Candidatus Latescibacteria bacterium]|jgi:phosphate:Na+ symporter|nr:Na/Pi cotransporter family protein [Candidatus Latescibacterota bacterium]